MRRGKRVGKISEDRKGSESGGIAPKAEAFLSLLYATGQRPDAEAIDRALSLAGTGMVSHRPPAGENPAAAVDWVEILASGLTFDAIGIAPGGALSASGPMVWRGLSESDMAGAEAIGVAPGPHLAGAGHVLPVIKANFGVAAALLAHCAGALGAVWRPSGLGTGAKAFVDLVASWLEGGPFPGPALIDFGRSETGDLTSRGLAFFLGRELRIRAALGVDDLSARRLGFRLADRFVERGGLDTDTMLAREDGSWLRISLGANEIIVDPA